METGIRLIAQHYNIATGETLEESVLREDKISKAETLNELGYLHLDQIDFLQKIQDFKIEGMVQKKVFLGNKRHSEAQPI